MITKIILSKRQTPYAMLNEICHKYDYLVEEALKFVLLKNSDAPARWIGYKSGLTDGELDTAIAFEFGAYQEFHRADSWFGKIVFQFMGKDCAPLVICNFGSNNPILFGKPLLEVVRCLMEIPYPDTFHYSREPAEETTLVSESQRSLWDSPI